MLWLLLPALAQSLVVPPGAEPGAPAEVVGEGLPPGTYALEMATPEGEEKVFTVEAPDGRFRFTFTPEEGGEYRFRLMLGEKPLEAVLEVVLPAPHFSETGLWLRPGLEVKLPEPASWMGPVVAGAQVYVARPLLVLEIHRFTGAITRHYPPNRVKELLPGPELALVDGRRLGLEEIRTLPFEAPWSELAALAKLERSLGDYRGYRPYWSLWAERRSDPAALSAMGKDLFARGHRVELAWGEDPPFGYLVAAAEKARGEGIEQSLALTRFLFDHLPLFPGSAAFFQDAADWLWAQGLRAEAARLRTGTGWLGHYRRLGLAGLLGGLFLFFLVAYLALFLKALFSGGRPFGARLFFTERLLLPLLLLGVAASGTGYLLARQVAGELGESFSRASLQTLAAREAIAALPEGPEREALLSGKGERVPSAALRLRAGRPAAALAWDRDSGPVLEALALGGDPWTAVYAGTGESRPLGPSDRELELLLAAAQARAFAARPLATLNQAVKSPLLLGLMAVLVLLLFLLHLPALFRGSPARPNLLVRLWELLVPGLLGFGAGVGLLLLAAALYGAFRLYQGGADGAFWLAAAYLLNLIWLAADWRGARA